METHYFCVVLEIVVDNNNYCESVVFLDAWLVLFFYFFYFSIMIVACILSTFFLLTVLVETLQGRALPFLGHGKEGSEIAAMPNITGVVEMKLVTIRENPMK